MVVTTVYVVVYGLEMERKENAQEASSEHRSLKQQPRERMAF